MTEENNETVDTNQEVEAESETNEAVDEDNHIEAEVLDSEEHDTESLQEELAKVKQENDDLYQKLMRSQAEFENFKKRTRKERENDQKYKAQDLADKLLPALDNFERALNQEVTIESQNFVDGITMVYNQIKEAMESQGVEKIDAVGQPFDPNLHHAVMQVEDQEQESNTVVEELQTGYKLKDRVIRPSMVKVNQ